MRILVPLLVISMAAACERAENHADVVQRAPTRVEPDPVQAARAEFELAPADARGGTSKLYSRGDFLADGPFSEAAFDMGDFLGRARTLFGAVPDDDYVLRHKATGRIITIYSGDSGPSYGGVAVRIDKSVFDRDPVLSRQAPAPNDPTFAAYTRRQADVMAGPENARIIARLDALMSAVKPADWEKTFFYDDEPSVNHVGARDGESFVEELDVDAAMHWLLARRGFASDHDLLMFAATHKDDMRPFRAQVQAVLARYTAAVEGNADADERAILREELQLLRGELR